MKKLKIAFFQAEKLERAAILRLRIILKSISKVVLEIAALTMPLAMGIKNLKFYKRLKQIIIKVGYVFLIYLWLTFVIILSDSMR
ncbi:MAG: hypothetical protein FXF47_09935 [Candidatus Mcinerneyibacterium aminivorans]|uniref:Uncharacterized protein n=1 Tax=Candidatus Mcinerneyibacterium aminivorans TaxID=2703815 RepID=A0A5D0MD72_9BACT|nr:MAG: hypothetical protein FXF47_09935 [Candidatus Mcinerneyibacterium aminivorans]